MFESKFVKLNPVYSPKGRGRHFLESFNINDIERMVDDFFENEKGIEYKDSRYGIKKMLMEDLGVKVKGDIPVNIYKPTEDDNSEEENKEVYNIEFLIPGVNKEDINVSLKNEDEIQVKVKGKECKCKEEDNECEDCKDERYYVMEFNNSDMGMKSNVIFFERKSEFESNKKKSYINKDKIETKYNNGILKVKIELGREDDVSNIEIE